MSSFASHGLQLDNMCYNPVILACSDTVWDLALVLLNRMPCIYLVPDEFTGTAAAASIARLGWQAAVGSVKHLASCWEVTCLALRDAASRRLYSHMAAFDAAASSLSAAGLWPRALALLAAQPTGLRCGVGSFSARMAGAEWRQSLHLAQLMPQQGIPTSVVTDSSVISALSARENELRWQVAVCIFQRLAWELKPDSVAFGALSSTVGEASEWVRSLRLHEEQHCQQLSSFRTSITACERGSQWQCALQVLGSLHVAGLQDTNSLRAAVSY